MTPIEKIDRVKELVLAHYEGDRDMLSRWMAHVNPILDGQSPNNMIRKGKIDQLLAAVEESLKKTP